MGDIFFEHSVINPGRGKGTRISRIGRKVHLATQEYGRGTSPNEEALQQLGRLLEEHEGIPLEVRQQYLGLYRTSDSLRHMNRPVLAEVMVLMYQYNIATTEDGSDIPGLYVFSNPQIMQPYIDRILTRSETSDQKGKMSELQKKIVSIKMTDTMFAYLRNTLHLMSTAQQRSRSGDLSVMQGPQIDQQLDIAPSENSFAAPSAPSYPAASPSASFYPSYPVVSPSAPSYPIASPSAPSYPIASPSASSYPVASPSAPSYPSYPVASPSAPSYPSYPVAASLFPTSQTAASAPAIDISEYRPAAIGGGPRLF